MGSTSQKKYRWMFCSTQGNRVSPVYVPARSRTAHAGGAQTTDR